MYIHILHKYFKQKNYQFYSIVSDKENDNLSSKNTSYWDNYLNKAAILIYEAVKNVSNPEFVIIADQITQSKNGNPYEKYLSNKIYDLLKVKPFGVMRIESHSSTFLQLVDIFVGAISYDFTGGDKPRKLKFMKVLRSYLNVQNKINKDIVVSKPNNFSVLQMKKGSWL